MGTILFLLGPSDVINLVALIVALVALAVSLYSWRTGTRGARNDVLAQVRDWGGDVVQVLSDAIAVFELRKTKMTPLELEGKAADLRARSSALLDRGRFFFHNLRDENGSTRTEPAGHGVRPPILDLVLISYELIGSLSDKDIEQDRLRLALVYVKRTFVSTIQAATSFTSPPTVKRYEQHLAGLKPPPLPTEVSYLGLSGRYELAFDEDISL